MEKKNRGLLLWSVLLGGVAMVIVALKLVRHEGAPEMLAAKAQTVGEWLKGSGIHWKNLFFFLLVAIPGMAILTRVIAWYGKQFSEPSWRKPAVKEIEFVDENPIKPYATYEEYRKDLTGDVDLEHFLARCRAGVPKEVMMARLKQDELKKAEAERKARKEAHDRIWDEGRRMLDQRLAMLGARVENLAPPNEAGITKPEADENIIGYRGLAPRYVQAEDPKARNNEG
jgi:hypothetical protein